MATFCLWSPGWITWACKRWKQESNQNIYYTIKQFSEKCYSVLWPHYQASVHKVSVRVILAEQSTNTWRTFKDSAEDAKHPCFHVGDAGGIAVADRHPCDEGQVKNIAAGPLGHLRIHSGSLFSLCLFNRPPPNNFFKEIRVLQVICRNLVDFSSHHYSLQIPDPLLSVLMTLCLWKDFENVQLQSLSLFCGEEKIQSIFLQSTEQISVADTGF